LLRSHSNIDGGPPPTYLPREGHLVTIRS
jgi:hypothetical protein